MFCLFCEALLFYCIQIKQRGTNVIVYKSVISVIDTDS